MALRIRRGTEAQRTGKTFELGELVYTTDAQQLWVGDGITAGGTAVVGSNVAGPGLFFNTSTRRLQVQGLTTDEITQGVNNKYFSTELAVDAVGAALVAGNLTNVGITFTYSQTQDDAGRINATVALDGVGITDVVNDTSPSLGGDLDLNTNDIFGTGNIDITGDITANGDIFGSSITVDTSSLGDASITNLTTDVIHAPDSGQGMEIVSKVGNSFAVGYYNGTYSVKTPIVRNTGGMVVSIKGWNGTEYTFASGFAGQWDADAVLTDSAPKSGAAIFSGAGGDAINLATLNSSGVWNAPVLQTTVYSVAGTPLPNASTVGAGARAFVSDATADTFATAYTGSGANNVPVYSDGTIWRIG